MHLKRSDGKECGNLVSCKQHVVLISVFRLGTAVHVIILFFMHDLYNFLNKNQIYVTKQTKMYI